MRKPLLLLKLMLVAAFASQPLVAAGDFVDRHSANNVEWLEWDETLAQKASEEEKPLFFFVGHFGNSLTRAMAVETFANNTIASMVNDTVVPVAVNANDSPELAAYLFHLAETRFEAADWPVCIWTTPKLAPLAGGGYFPPTDDWGGQGFLSLGRNVHEQWTSDKENYVSAANERLAQSLNAIPFESSSERLESAIENSQIQQPDVQELRATSLLSLSKTEADISKILENIILSAGFDSIEGGFFIGSNDANWRMPLFQKSATDQALMLTTLANLNESDPNAGYSDAINLTTDFIERSLIKPNKLSRQYIDSFAANETMDMAEGSHYLVQAADMAKIGENAAKPWGLLIEGNVDLDTDILEIYKSQNIPYSTNWSALAKDNDEYRNQLLEIRSTKPAPLSDDTGYTSTNALLVQAFARIAKTTGDKLFKKKAIELLEAIEKTCSDSNGKRIYNSDQQSHLASSQAYANLIAAYLDLHDITSKKSYLKKAITTVVAWQEDSRFSSMNETARILLPEISFAIARDHAIPSVVATQLRNLKRLAETTGDNSYSERAPTLLKNVPKQIEFKPEHYLSLAIAEK